MNLEMGGGSWLQQHYEFGVKRKIRVAKRAFFTLSHILRVLKINDNLPKNHNRTLQDHQ